MGDKPVTVPGPVDPNVAQQVASVPSESDERQLTRKERNEAEVQRQKEERENLDRTNEAELRRQRQQEDLGSPPPNQSER